MLQDTYLIYSIIMFIQTILDSLDHMLTKTSLLLTYKSTFTSYGDRAFDNFLQHGFAHT